MKKILLGEGCSWTAGSIINPKLEGITSNVMDTRNADYRLPKMWPDKLGKLLNVKVKNDGHAGSSNDSIVRRTIENVLTLLEEYKAEDIFVIVGWTSPERRDFYFKDLLDAKDSGHWQSLYPAQLSADIKNMQHVDLKKFFTLYTQYFWNEEEYLSRYVNQNMFLHYFLEQHNVSHIFYNAFYDSLHHIGPEFSFNASKGDLNKRHILNGLTDASNSWGSQNPHMNKAVEEFFRIENKVFKDITFRKFIMDIDIRELEKKKGLKPFEMTRKNDNVSNYAEQGDNDKFLYDGHPSSLGHQLWAEELYKDLPDEWKQEK